MKRFFAAACAASMALSCDPWPEWNDDDDGGSGSGFGRWTVKTGHDDDVRTVESIPRTATIAALRAIAPPSNLGGDTKRFTHPGSPEMETYRLTNVTLAGFKLESDGDYHLVLQDGGGKSLIAEIVDPRRVADIWKPQTTQARDAFDARHAASGNFQTARETVTVTGVGFFDLLHGQLGAALSGIELHPVLDICFGPDCATEGPIPRNLRGAAPPP